MDKHPVIVLANFGGPRHLKEIPSFLKELLTDQEVIRTGYPNFLHRIIFAFVAKKRAKFITPDYQLIGGKSPIYEDTENLAIKISHIVGGPVIPFHRYLKDTHRSFQKKLQSHTTNKILVFPLFPQFTYATTGSCAKWFCKNLSPSLVTKMRWIRSYPNHPSFINAHYRHIQSFLKKNQLNEKEVFFLFSAHGIPASFVDSGDIYQDECEKSFHALLSKFPHASGCLSYQSQFGKEEWIRPYTSEVCGQIKKWNPDRKHVVFIPISFTSDHIETLYEIEQLYLPPVKDHGLLAWRCPALNVNKDWIDAIVNILENENYSNNQMLLRH